MQTAKIFMNGRSQAVRLPKEFRFSGTEVFIKKSDEGLLLIPKQDDPWEAWEENLLLDAETINLDREDIAEQKREGLDDLFN